MKTLLVSSDPRLQDAFAHLARLLPQVSESAVADTLGIPLPPALDVLFFDTRGGAASLEALVRLKAQKPALEVVMLTETATPESLLAAMRAGVREVLTLPLAAAEMNDALDRLRRARAASAISPGKVVAVIGAKGGVGATFIAANLCHAMALVSGQSALLCDLASEGGDCAHMVSERIPAASLDDVLMSASTLDATLLKGALMEAAPNFFLLAASRGFEPPRPGEIAALIELARAEFANVVLDSPHPGNAALQAADVVLVVLQLTLPALRHTRLWLSRMAALGVPQGKLKLILNRAGKHHGALTLEDAEAALGQPIFAAIPNDWASVNAACNQGSPIALAGPGGPIDRALRDLAARLLDKPMAQQSLLSRILPRRLAKIA